MPRAFVGAPAPLARLRLRTRRGQASWSVASRPPTMALRVPRGVRVAAAVAAAAAAGALGNPRAADALLGLGRRREPPPPVITMTNQVPTTFSLPSQGKASGAQSGVPGVLGGAMRIVVKRVVPAVAVVAVAVWALSRVLKRAQEKQLRDFQSQLQSFNGMLDLDGVGGAGGEEELSPAEMARRVMSKGGNRYKFRDDAVETEAEKIAAQVRLDLFQNGTGRGGGDLVADMDAMAAAASAQPTQDAEATAAALAAIKPVAAVTAYEKAVAAALDAIENGGQSAAEAAKPLKAAREEAGMSVEDAKLAFNTFVSKVVSVQIDKAAVTLGMAGAGKRAVPTEENAVEGLKYLSGLSGTMRATNEIASEAGLVSGLAYVGAQAGDDKVREELYRAYAVFSLSDESRVKDESTLQGLLDMQMVLSLSDERAEAVNTEIAKGMFQVAVSGAMADGSMTNESKEALEQLKSSFGDFLDGGSADNIISEVGVMRAMYSLQQLLQEQGVSDEDVAELRKMCADLGVDIDDMMKNADQMGDALGPEAKQFVGGLRALLKDGDASGMVDGIGGIMASAGLDAQAAAKVTDADVASRPGIASGDKPKDAGPETA